MGRGKAIIPLMAYSLVPPTPGSISTLSQFLIEHMAITSKISTFLIVLGDFGKILSLVLGRLSLSLFSTKRLSLQFPKRIKGVSYM